MKRGKKFAKLIDLERKLEGESTKLKIREFGSRLAKKSSSEWDRNFQILKSQKSKIEID